MSGIRQCSKGYAGTRSPLRRNRKDRKRRPRILCVDDEPNVLESLELNLEQLFSVKTSTGGAEALSIIEAEEPFAVVVSDMRMPGMDGARFLARVREVSPDSVRMLLTGYAEIDAAIAAINEGQVFRFLTKPCPPDLVQTACQAAAEMHELVIAERVLLEQTLTGSIRAMADILGLTDPLSFGRAERLRRATSELAAAIEMADSWQVEVAAMVSQLGCVTLPASTVAKVHAGRPLSSEEQGLLKKTPMVVEQLLRHIPRLEGVREILRRAVHEGTKPPKVTSSSDAAVELGAEILRIVVDFDDLQTRGLEQAAALGTMRGRVGRYQSSILDAFSSVLDGSNTQERIEERSLLAVRPGMVFVEDVRLANGALLVARGYEVTESFVQRVRNYPPGAVQEVVRVKRS